MAALELMETPFKRLWRGYLVARVFVALLLALGAMAITPVLSGPLLSQLALLGTYGVSAMLYAALSHKPPPQRRVYAWLPTVGMDLLLISLLEVTKTGTYTLTPMFGLAVLFAGTLGGWLVTLGSCAYITIFLIVESLSFRTSVFELDATQNTVQAGLAGAAYFLVGILVRLLASRVERETLHGLRNAAAANQQEQINALILQNLPDGVLVADQALQVRIANPAAMALLGHPHLPLELAQLPAWRAVVEQVTQTFAGQKPLSQDLALTAPQTAPIGLHVRTWLTHPLPTFGSIGSHDNDPLCLVFLHDLREIEARLRTEKMAAMGRMSAAVAHEIRNPLTAITQANALLDEELTDPGQKRLTYMVEQNAQRLGRIAEDILDIARVHNQIQPGDGESVALNETVLQICHDWMSLAPAAHTLALALDADDSLVAFDTGHLRQLLYNLLNNGQRYRSSHAGSLRVGTHSSLTGTTTLVVWSDGAPIEPTIEKHLFEPFFSSESRSSGLGLYICRELCTRHGAMIRYERQSAALPELAQGNAFIVQFRRAASPAHPLQTDLIHQA